MNSSFNNSLLDSSVDFPNCVDPSEACGLTLPLDTQYLNLIPTDSMESTGRVSLEKFSGYPTDDAERFLSNFSAYCTFSRINPQDLRTVAAFQLHLQGPALTWFTCLNDSDKNSWENVKQLYQAKYMDKRNKPVLLVETEQFLNLRLLPHQQMEDYYSKIMEKGRRINKNDQEIVLKFIEGLPSQLAFFVRAGNPEDIHAALTAAKLGEAYGYRASPSPAGCDIPPAASTVAAVQPSDKLKVLEQKLDKLFSEFNKVRLSRNTEPFHNRQQSTCHACKGAGHIKRFCNWARGNNEPNIQCQLCEQFGHRAINCCLNSGNGRSPRDTGRVPLGGCQ